MTPRRVSIRLWAPIAEKRTAMLNKPNEAASKATSGTLEEIKNEFRAPREPRVQASTRYHKGAKYMKCKRSVRDMSTDTKSPQSTEQVRT